MNEIVEAVDTALSCKLRSLCSGCLTLVRNLGISNFQTAICFFGLPRPLVWRLREQPDSRSARKYLGLGGRQATHYESCSGPRFLPLCLFSRLQAESTRYRPGIYGASSGFR